METVTLQQLQRAAKIAAKLKATRDMDVLKNMTKSITKYGNLTPRQEDYARNLIARNSQETLSKLAKWGNEWRSDAKVREKYEVIARYYSTTGYYSHAVKEVLSALESDGVPDWRECKQMVSNAYAAKVWQSHSSPPKWKVGDMVTFRANPKGGLPGLPQQISRRKYRGLNSTPVMTELSYIVVEVNSRPINQAYAYNKTAGGCRWYKLLPVGIACQVEAMECNLKKLLKKQVT